MSLAPTSASKARWATPRRPERPTHGGVDRQVAALLGWKLFPWQSLAADVAAEYDPFTKLPIFRTVGISVSRQNGKTTLICVRVARQLILPRQTVAYTAQDRGLARTKWAEHVDLLLSTPFADRVDHVERTNHREILVMQNGSRYMPVTPSQKKAARSLSVDLAVIDEANSHESMGVVSSIKPTMATRPHAQLYLCANAGDLHAKLWRHYTDIGRSEIDNPASTMAWTEYAADPECDVMDPKAWADANPSLGLPGGVLESALRDGALTMDRATFLREHLNVWADADQLAGIDATVWSACRRDDVMPGTDVGLGLDFTPERDRAALVVAGEVENVVALEVIEAGSDLEQITGRAAEVACRWDCLITIDAGSPAASAVPALEQATKRGDGTHRVRVVPSTEFVRACGGFHDAAVAGQLSHRGDYRLSDAVAGATKRDVGDAWKWERRGHADITCLTAATLARWGVVTAPELLTPAIY